MACSGRLHHLAFALPGTDAGASHPTHDESTELPGLLPSEGPARVIEPDDNLGTRLVLVHAGADLAP